MNGTGVGDGPRGLSPAFGVQSRMRLALATLSVIALAAGMVAAPPALPPITGELTGGFEALRIPTAPGVRWRVELKAGAAPGDRRAELQLEAAGLALTADVELRSLHAGAWTLRETRIEAGTWFAAVASQLGPAVAGLKVDGVLTLSGAGEFDGGRISGRFAFVWLDGSVRNDAEGWWVEGIRARGAWKDLPGMVSDGPVEFTFQSASAAGIEMGKGEIIAQVDSAKQVRVTRARFEALDGRVEFRPFEVNPAQPDLKTEVRFAGVELSRLTALLPSVLANASGAVTGRMDVTWSQATGLRSANATFRPDAGPASVRLTPAPGFLTSRLPERMRERIDLLPAWLGPLRGLFSPVNPAYETLRAIEMGQMRLEVSTLEVTIDPSGDPQGRTARVVVQAQPAAERSVVESVRFEINVKGPLADLLRLGLEGRLKVSTR